MDKCEVIKKLERIRTLSEQLSVTASKLIKAASGAATGANPFALTGEFNAKLAALYEELAKLGKVTAEDLAQTTPTHLLRKSNTSDMRLGDNPGPYGSR